MNIQIPLGLMTDSYKEAHFLMYPDNVETMYAYGEFRKPLFENDHRIIFYGMQYIISQYINRQWTLEDLKETWQVLANHGLGTGYPFPKDLFMDMITENDGYFPVTIWALPEGSVVMPHTPVFAIRAEKKWAKLVTFLETVLTMVWYPSTVATLSRHTKELISEYFDKTVEDSSKFLLDSRLHDFGYRGCTTNEQAMLGGSAHLLSFTGTDTLAALAYINKMYSGGAGDAGTSIPATEHSVMMSWPSELAAVQNMVDKFGHTVFATVADTYDYDRFLNEILPVVAPQVKAKGGTHIVRPDSGDPVETVLKGLRACAVHYGYTVNSLGYKVLNNSGVIQGDGISYKEVKKILEAVVAEGFSAQNVAFGMGGGLLQKLNRDTLSFATKLSYIEFTDHTQRDLMKKPKTDSGKFSLPGRFEVVKELTENRSWEDKFTTKKLIVRPSSNYQTDLSLLHCIYHFGPVWYNEFINSWSSLKKELNINWEISPKIYNPISKDLQTKIDNYKVP